MNSLLFFWAIACIMSVTLVVFCVTQSRLEDRVRKLEREAAKQKAFEEFIDKVDDDGKPREGA